MNKITTSLIILVIFAGISNAQAIPDKIKKYLDANYSSQENGNWQGQSDDCGDSKVWSQTADFNGDGQTDYLVRFTTGKTVETKHLNVIAFISKDDEFMPAPIVINEVDDERAKGLSDIVIKSGTSVNLGIGEEGEGSSRVLKNDGVMIQVCETDDAGTYVFDKGEMKLIRETVEEKPNKANDSASLPENIKQILDKKYKGWTKVPKGELCGEKNLFETGDFNNDGKTDYAVYFMTNKKGKKNRLMLLAFIDRGSFYKVAKVTKRNDPNDFPQMSFEIDKKGEKVYTGEGEDDFILLKTDVIREFICETDDSKTFAYKSGKFAVMDLYSP